MKLTNEVKIALTAIAAVALLFVGINFLKGINVFESSNSYYVKFKDIKGLAATTTAWWCAWNWTKTCASPATPTPNWKWR